MRSLTLEMCSRSFVEAGFECFFFQLNAFDGAMNSASTNKEKEKDAEAAAEPSTARAVAVGVKIWILWILSRLGCNWRSTSEFLQRSLSYAERQRHVRDKSNLFEAVGYFTDFLSSFCSDSAMQPSIRLIRVLLAVTVVRLPKVMMKKKIWKMMRLLQTIQQTMKRKKNGKRRRSELTRTMSVWSK